MGGCTGEMRLYHRTTPHMQQREAQRGQRAPGGCPDLVRI